MESYVKAILLAAGLFLAWKFASVLLLIFASILLAVALGGLTSLVQKYTKLPRHWSFPMVFVFSILFIALLTLIAAPSVSSQFDDFSARFPVQAQKAIASINDIFNTDIPSDIEGLRAYIDPSYVLQATQTVSDSFGVFADIFFLLVIAVYLAASPGDYDSLLNKLSKRNQKSIQRSHHDLKWWLMGRFSSMLIIFILTTIGLYILGIPFALILGLLAGLLSFIPNLGPLLALVPALIVAFVQSPLMAAYVILLYIGIQVLESYLITPQIDRKTISLPPAMQLISQLVFGAMFGFMGLVMAVPITVTIRSFFSE